MLDCASDTAMSRGQDKWLTPIALIMSDYLADNNDDDENDDDNGDRWNLIYLDDIQIQLLQLNP